MEVEGKRGFGGFRNLARHCELEFSASERFYFEIRGAQLERGVRFGRKDGVIEFGIRRICAQLQHPFALLRIGAAGEGVGLENYPAVERQPSFVGLRRAVVEKYFEAP